MTPPPHRRSTPGLLAALLLPLLLGITGGCAGSAPDAKTTGAQARGSASAAEALRVANGRVELPIGREDPSAYFVIQNRSSETRTIIGATSARAESVALRRATVRDGRMASEALPEMAIPAGGAVAFAPRGLFLRLMNAEPLAAGETVPIELVLKDGGRVAFEAVVEAD